MYIRELTEPYRWGDYYCVRYQGTIYKFTWETEAYEFYIEHGGKRR